MQPVESAVKQMFSVNALEVNTILNVPSYC